MLADSQYPSSVSLNRPRLTNVPDTHRCPVSSPHSPLMYPALHTNVVLYTSNAASGPMTRLPLCQVLVCANPCTCSRPSIVSVPSKSSVSIFEITSSSSSSSTQSSLSS